jgi:hypothetical protein
MILEAILSTRDEDGKPRFAPIGLFWGEERVELRVFRTSRTCRNLTGGRGAVANLTDDVFLFVRCALKNGTRDEPPHRPSGLVPGGILDGACSYRELRILSSEEEGERTRFVCAVAGTGTPREFLGFNRAAGALLEATVVATRPAWAVESVWRPLLQRARLLTEKTGGERERAALALLESWFEGGSP